MSVLLALGAALAWGSSDFAAGHASRRDSAVSVVVLTHLTSALVLATLVWGATPGLADLGWGVAAGLGGGIGAMLLFRGLSRASMAVVAPITAAGAAAIPALVGVALGESLGTNGLAGVALALVAIVLISLTGGGAEPPAVTPDAVDDVAPASGAGAATAVAARPVLATSRAAIVDALLSGVGFGLFFVCISRASEAAGNWPLLAGRSVSVLLFVLVALRTAVPVLPSAASRRPVILAGVLDAVAALAFVLATRDGLLSIGAVLASLYPAATVVLARVVAGERIAPRQLVGLGLAATAVSLLAI